MRQSEHELENNFKIQIISEGSEFLLRTKSRDNVGTVSTAGQPADRLGNVDSFHGLRANIYSFKTENSCWEVDVR